MFSLIGACLHSVQIWKFKKGKRRVSCWGENVKKGNLFSYLHNVKDFDPYFTYCNSGLACLHSGFCSGNCQAHKQVENNFF
jgi:hypothetical protein